MLTEVNSVKRKVTKIILLCLFLAIVLAFGLSFLLESTSLSYAGVLLTVALVIVYSLLWR